MSAIPAALALAIARFVAKDKRERITFLAGKPGRRADLIDALLHDRRSLAREVLVPVAATPAAALAALGAKPTTPSYVLSAIGEVDDRELPLGEALAAIAGRACDSLIVCETLARAYYENHEGEAFVLR